jgi:hypothetical protein
MPWPFIPAKSSSVYTLPLAAAGLFALALRAASAGESSFWDGGLVVAGRSWVGDGDGADAFCDEEEDDCGGEEACAKVAAAGQLSRRSPDKAF